MQVEKKILAKWSRLKQKGDIKAIAKIAGIAWENISIAIRSGEMTEEVFTVIATFYNEREQRVKALA